MKRAIVGAIAWLVLLLAPTTAQAGYYLSERQAESTTRRFLHYTLGYHHTAASCRPQFLSRPEPGYVYHRWVCSWAAGDRLSEPDCVGVSRVRGSDESGSFYWRVLYHRGQCQYGWRE